MHIKKQGVPKRCTHKVNIPYYNLYTSFWDIYTYINTYYKVQYTTLHTTRWLRVSLLLLYLLMSSSYHNLILTVYSQIIMTRLSEHGWSFNTQLPRIWYNDDDDADDQDGFVHYNCVVWELESDWLYLNSIYPIFFPIEDCCLLGCSTV
jgi:hypothetical protein